MERKKKIALFSCHEDPNYGSMLQAYALATAIKRMGYDAEYITYRTYPKQSLLFKCIKRTIKEFLLRTGLMKDHNPFHFFNTQEFSSTIKAFREFHKKYIPSSIRIYHSNTIGSELPLVEYSTYIVGSDQLWSPLNYECDSRIPYFLDFTELPSRSSYATSLGTTILSDRYKDLLKEKLSVFDHLSCREKSNTEMLTQLLGQPVEEVLDPTLLLTTEDWDQIAIDTTIANRYVLAYILGEKNTLVDFAERLGKTLAIPVYYIATRPKHLNHKNVLTGIGPDAFIGLLKKATYVVTDSFHGCLFCINYKVQFYAFSKREGNLNSQDNIRIVEFLQSLHLEDRFQDDTHATLIQDCDYELPHHILNKKRETSLAYLSLCLK